MLIPDQFSKQTSLNKQKKLGDDDAESMFTLTILEKKFNCISKQFNFKRNK